MSHQQHRVVLDLRPDLGNDSASALGCCLRFIVGYFVLLWLHRFWAVIASGFKALMSCGVDVVRLRGLCAFSLRVLAALRPRDFEKYEKALEGE